MIRIHLLAFEGCEEQDLFGPWEVLRKAQQLGAPFEVTMGVCSEPAELKLALGARLAPLPRLDVRSGDWVLVPGGGWVSRAPQGTWAEVERGDLPKQLQDWQRQGVCFASVCTGAMLLAKAGITMGRVAATHHGAAEELEAMGALVVPARVVDDGDLVTAGGVCSGIDLGLWLAERFAGPEFAAKLQEELEYPLEFQVYFGPRSTQEGKS